MLRLSKGSVISVTWDLLNLSNQPSCIRARIPRQEALGQEIQHLVPEHGHCRHHVPESLTARGSLVGKPGPGTPLPVAPTPALVRWQATRFALDLRSAGNPHFLPSQAFPWQDPQEGPARHAQKVSAWWHCCSRNANHSLELGLSLHPLHVEKALR